MRIAVVVERFEPRGGGAERVAWRVAHGLAEAGDEVRVIARRADSAARLPVTRVPVRNAWKPLRVLAFSRAAARAAPRGAGERVLSFSRTRHQDVYRAGGGSHADYLARRRAPGLRKWSPRHAVLLETERRIFADRSQLVVCVSEMVRAELLRRYGLPLERTALLWNGVDLAVRPRRHADGAPVWLFAGTGFARKGLDTALRALALASRTDARLRVAGADDPRPWRRLATRLGVAERVHFEGFRGEPAELYAGVDALVLPTRYDAFANVCLEAAAAGVPCVTSGANGAAGLLGDAALRVDDPEDAHGFARALDRLSDATTRERLGEAARGVAEGHGWDAHVSALRGLLA